MEIFTIGHSNRSLEEFVSLLKHYGIKQIVDVRRFPTSKVVPHFKKEILKAALEKSGIEYKHIERLGGYRKIGYKEYVKTKEFRSALRELIELAEKKKTAIMCSEALWFKCHRRYIADELVKLGWIVKHIITKERVIKH
ncbi:MAG TPA: DUF488 domain-containing protein, partial [Candidatus Woesearchaeota archaeon]|nr:DUF488 domain-containing protein [Candidatus Woesearchaeota archaeon]